MTAAAVWDLWSDPSRWPDWNGRIEGVEIDGPFAAGTKVKLKQKGGGTVHAKLVAVEPPDRFAYEARLPGARLGYEHRIAAREDGSEILNRVYITGPLSGFWRVMIGKKLAGDGRNGK
jgi:uncharacterized protein YndB with AHSA1/START domain